MPTTTDVFTPLVATLIEPSLDYQLALEPNRWNGVNCDVSGLVANIKKEQAKEDRARLRRKRASGKPSAKGEPSKPRGRK